MTLSAEIEPGPHWWKASALTTRPTLPPQDSLMYTLDIFNSSKSMSNMKKMPHVYDQICSYLLKKHTLTKICLKGKEGKYCI